MNITDLDNLLTDCQTFLTIDMPDRVAHVKEQINQMFVLGGAAFGQVPGGIVTFYVVRELVRKIVKCVDGVRPYGSLNVLGTQGETAGAQELIVTFQSQVLLQSSYLKRWSLMSINAK